MAVRVAIRPNCHNYMYAFYFAFYTEENQDKIDFIYGRETLDVNHEKSNTPIPWNFHFEKIKDIPFDNEEVKWAPNHQQYKFLLFHQSHRSNHSYYSGR